MDFKEILIRSQSGDRAALEMLYLMFKPLIVKRSYVNGTFDEDLFQRNCETLLRCVKAFQIDP